MQELLDQSVKKFLQIFVGEFPMESMEKFLKKSLEFMKAYLYEFLKESQDEFLKKPLQEFLE